MARRLRIEYAGALYQLTLRGNTEKDTYRDDIYPKRLKFRCNGAPQSRHLTMKIMFHSVCQCFEKTLLKPF